ncbi:subtilisin family serine protease [Clostridium saccharobutylicum]|uniref:S8 family serine peptidase n=1 Tax=Clostridium saccharobutylicum TaxID=169679 RepID=UPI001494E6A5|nr:S8 family serine peptidase [Clostridium saccharobutylicum]NOV83455.1 subtilisin family serine protease [Clostridium saccharobutylicum]
MEEGVKVAILDNGVMDIFYEELKENIYIDEENSINNASIYRNKYSSHGTSCFLILKQFAKSSRISSVEILNEDGKGSIEKLIPAFEWCVENDIKIVNLSFGSIHFKDAEIIQNIINHYASKGIIIIAASSNSGYTSYPSYFSNVIGVANIEDSGIKDDMVRVNNVHTGVDFLAVSQHTIYIEDENIILSKSNSYAAPFVTSQVYNILSHNVNLTLYEVKKTLINQLKKQNEESSLFYCEPNWIENAYIVGGKLKSKARTYFKLFKNCSYEDVKEKIDTLIIFNENDLNFYLRKKEYCIFGK